MKSFRIIALSVIVTISTFGAILYTSCTKDACKGVTCLNGGTCSGGTCTCPTGYIGASCQTRAFVGTWQGGDACTPTVPGITSITITMANSSVDSTTVIIGNAGGFAQNVNGTLSSDGKTISYNNQIVNPSSSPDTLSGTIVLTDNTHFTHTYTAKEGVVYSCSGQYSKQ